MTLEVEQMIEDMECNAPRITPDHIENCIKSVQYHVFPDTMTTVCCMTLKNGYAVIGKSACAHPDNFRSEIGTHIAYEDAKRQIGALEGYLLCQTLSMEE